MNYKHKQIFLWVLWAALVISQTWGGGSGDLWFIASQPEAQVTA